ncbi:MAG: hypothetical protein CBB82_08005 [Betaproteobacteria bacterium TMED22]|nr:MAG: hypothetical protein CBB82_08005 [Betaproteobacteria bacterium TMED22]|tara:strand:+ start:20849 stop:21904 length:1056 start_codon:yes stop_codon:yes gene_type:complete
MRRRYTYKALKAFAISLLNRSGMDPNKSVIIADVLIEGDLLGHDTHGLQLLAPYLSDIKSGAMATTGEPDIISDLPAAVAWNGKRLPGTWLTSTAMDLAVTRAKTCGTCTVTIAGGHHIACLAAYLLRATEKNMVAIIMSSAPENKSVAPFGGKTGALTPNPIAAGWPTDDLPVLIDVSTSITTNGMVTRAGQAKEKLAGPWLIDHNGKPTNDPNVIKSDKKGALLPVGGLNYGHKGFALGLMVEALTQGLTGHGRADNVTEWTGEVFLQVLNPDLFGGINQFTRQTNWIKDACLNSEPIDPRNPVRIPGQEGIKKRQHQLLHGIMLHPSIMPALNQWASDIGIQAPKPIE